VAGNRFGKTEVGCEFCLIQLLDYELLPPWLHPYKIERFAGRSCTSGRSASTFRAG
jgi:hypothetical protein